MFTFKRGVRLPENKPGQETVISKIDTPEKLYIPLQQHIGKPAKALVKVGDYVKKYQKIGEAQGKISANIHASSSGKVTEAGKQIVIETDGEDLAVELKKTEHPNKEEIIQIIREAGIVGMGGATFPTDVKLQPPGEIEEFILNGCECEPYLTTDYRLMLEETEKIVMGMKQMIKACNAKRGIIAIEENKRDAFKKVHKLAAKENIETVLVKTKYPQGAEKMLIHAITKKKVPTGKLPSDVNCVVNNVATAKAVHDAVYEGKPLTERVVTVTGAVNKPMNILTRIGTPFEKLIQKAGIKDGVKKIIAGGPMMGTTIDDTGIPVLKGTSGILLQKEPVEGDFEHCIRCGECLRVCPMKLAPTKIATFADKEMYNDAKKTHAMDCIECGCCAYACPSRIPLVQYIRLAKEGIRNEANKS